MAELKVGSFRALMNSHRSAIIRCGMHGHVVRRLTVKGDRVEIRGLCSFHVKKYGSYTGWNPKTGQIRSHLDHFFVNWSFIENRILELFIILDIHTCIYLYK